MKWKIIFCLVFSANIYPVAVNALQCAALADSLFVYNNYYDAITEYERCIFQQGDSIDRSAVENNISLCYYGLGNNASALQHMQMAISFCENDSVADARTLQLGLMNIFLKKYDQSEFIFKRVRLTTQYSYVKYYASLFLAWGYFLNQNKNKALAEMDSIKVNYGDETNGSTLNLLKEQMKVDLKSETTAKILSYIIPGLGQLYVKDYANSANAILLNAFFLYFIIDSICSKEYTDLLAQVAVFQTYYRGNTYRAADMAINYNDKVIASRENIIPLIYKLLQPANTP